MDVVRKIAMTSVVLVTAVVCACADETKQTASSSSSSNEADKPAPVPDPPPRYKHSIVDTNDDVALPLNSKSDGGGGLQIKCGGREPYVCMMDDGTFRCSDIPCVPSCDRIGCLGGDICTPCEGGYRCLSPGDHC